MEPSVLLIMGSDSDVERMRPCFEQLDGLGIVYEAHVCSAHRSPAFAAQLAGEARGRGIKLIIAAAGMAAHLAGAAAAQSTLPIIGVPLDAGGLGGLDALLSTVQMPPGVPVATMAIGKAGAHNAALFAAQILSLSDEGLAAKLEQLKAEQALSVASKDAELSKQLNR
ncbi:MAG: 5-(carboxyamino)imidazole ribonucleotide mutase [Candidatus Alcyoniella australis]|nr:5-(carboxyamino)imidazole ribonucleotide mutase [Candidatus Alcyoniella australis]